MAEGYCRDIKNTNNYNTAEQFLVVIFETFSYSWNMKVMRQIITK